MVSRFEFVRGNWGSKKPVRPPWSKSEEILLKNCDRCGDCIKSCENKIIVKGSGGYPEINFSIDGCSFCQDCAQICEQDVFDLSLEYPWGLYLDISQSCIALNRVVCRSCAEQCDNNAISIKLAVGGISIPEIDKKACTACGYCISVCPSNSIKLLTGSED